MPTLCLRLGEDKRKDNAMKVAKTAPITFPAHRVIIENCSSIFICVIHTMIGKLQSKSMMYYLLFSRLLLSYVYGGKIPDDNMRENTKEIIDAADKYGVVNLKLEAEASFLVGATFTIENVMELLLYAESKKCALLKEAALDFMVKNKANVIKKLTINSLIPGSLITDILY
jgi:hypothetical protein